MEESTDSVSESLSPPLRCYSLDNRAASEAERHTWFNFVNLGQIWHYIYPTFSAGKFCLYISNSYHSTSYPLNIQFKLNIWSLAVGFHLDAVLIEFETWFSNISQGSKTVNWRRERVVIKLSRLVALRPDGCMNRQLSSVSLLSSPLPQYED